VKYNVSVTFCGVPFFVGSRRGKTLERICMHNGLKRVKSGKDGLLGFRQKMITPTSSSPRNPKILHYESCFLLKTRINLVVSATKICNRIGNSPSSLKFRVKNLTGSSFMAVSAHAHLKWPKWSKTQPNWQKFRFCTKPRTENLILHSVFEAEVQS